MDAKTLFEQLPFGSDEDGEAAMCSHSLGVSQWSNSSVPAPSHIRSRVGHGLNARKWPVLRSSRSTSTRGRRAGPWNRYAHVLFGGTACRGLTSTPSRDFGVADALTVNSHAVTLAWSSESESTIAMRTSSSKLRNRDTGGTVQPRLEHHHRGGTAS